MKFKLTLNMASREGRAVHQITVDYPVDSLKAFCEILQTHDFVYAEEFYMEGGRKGDADYDPEKRAELRAHGAIVVNTAVIGKAKIFVP